MIKILCVGKIKEKYLEELIADYQKRISKYMKIEIVELKDDSIHEREIANLSKIINSKDYNVALDMRGNIFSSEEFASFVDKTLVVNSNITFIIGPSLGLNEEILNTIVLNIPFT